MVVVQADDQVVSVKFEDSGCGMDDETLVRVFDAHFTTRESGSGLGLHFCAIALKRFGGTIAATSEGNGRGSAITLGLPAAESPNACKSKSPRDLKRSLEPSGRTT